MFPRSKNKDWTQLKTRVCKGATIGAGSVILPGITIGENAFIAAGSVVTKDVPAGELWMGNPARFYREVDFWDFHFFWQQKKKNQRRLLPHKPLHRGFNLKSQKPPISKVLVKFLRPSEQASRARSTEPLPRWGELSVVYRLRNESEEIKWKG